MSNHLHANFKLKGFKGKAFKDELRCAAMTSNKNKFEHHMNKIKNMDPIRIKG